MSPHRAQRRASWAMVAGAVAIGALVLSVWLVGDRAASSLRDSERKARNEQAREQYAALKRQNTALRLGCARAVARDFEAWGTNRDLQGFAHEAAKVRRAEGQPAIARRYEMRADSARFRMIRIRARLPADDHPKTVADFCAGLYPEARPGAG